jgi:ATP-dependent 26S proteasome regulatory subunit
MLLFFSFRECDYQVIMATNRADTLDPALMRPGRLDRKIEFPNPDRRQKRMIFGLIAPSTVAYNWENNIIIDQAHALQR